MNTENINIILKKIVDNETIQVENFVLISIILVSLNNLFKWYLNVYADFFALINENYLKISSRKNKNKNIFLYISYVVRYQS